MQSQKWVLMLVILNLGLLYGVVKKWHANEVHQLKVVALGSQSSGESRPEHSTRPDPESSTKSSQRRSAPRESEKIRVRWEAKLDHWLRLKPVIQTGAEYQLLKSLSGRHPPVPFMDL